MTWLAYLELLFSLDNFGKVIKLDKQKMSEDKVLIRCFCTPCKLTITNRMLFSLFIYGYIINSGTKVSV